MNNIICPHCKKEVEISQAFKHQIKEELAKEFKNQHAKDLEQQKTAIQKETEERLKKEFDFKFKDSQNASEENRKKANDLEKQLLEMTKTFRQLQVKDQQRELEMEKKLISERQKMEEDLTKTIKERSDLEKAELQKKLEDTQKALLDAQRKAQQSSQQLQGEVLELNLETQLHESFPTDDILPVPKGIEGADILQKVKNKFGQIAGIILWETKRTKAWKKEWPAKLREDKRRADANIAILISDTLPDGIDSFGLHENIWVANYSYAIPLVTILRVGLFELAVAKSTTAHKDERLEALFAYLTKDSFRNRFEAQVESIISLKSDLDTEQRSTVRLWKKREMQIKRLLGNVAAMYGELQGILGSSLPSIPTLDSTILIEDKTGRESLIE